jgi:hypothetical protein
VGTTDDLLEVLELDVGVALGGGEKGVTEKRLDVPDVGSSLETSTSSVKTMRRSSPLFKHESNVSTHPLPFRTSAAM